MYLPSDMTFQYFFFDTYYGYLLQALPIALLAGIVYVIIKRKRRPQLSLGRTLLSRPLCLLPRWALVPHAFLLRPGRYLLLAFLPYAQRRRQLLVQLRI